MPATATTSAPAAGPWPVAADAWERAGGAGVEFDLARGCARVAGREMQLRPLPQAGAFQLDDGTVLRLPGFETRNHCVVMARGSDDPPRQLLQALRDLMLGPAPAAETRSARDGLLLALAGGALEAPPFCRCSLPDDSGDATAITVDLAAIERAGNPAQAGGWRRLQFGPVELDALIDEMLQRLLARGVEDDFAQTAVKDVVSTSADAAPMGSHRAMTQPARTAKTPRPQGRPALAATDAQPRSGEPSGAETGSSLRNFGRQASQAFAAARVPKHPGAALNAAAAPTPGPSQQGSQPTPAIRLVPTRRGDEAHDAGSTPRSDTPAQVVPPSTSHGTPGFEAGTPHRFDARPVEQMASLQPSWPSSPARPHEAASAFLPAATHSATPAAGAARPRPLPARDPLAEIARAIAGECDLRGLAP